MKTIEQVKTEIYIIGYSSHHKFLNHVWWLKQKIIISVGVVHVYRGHIHVKINKGKPHLKRSPLEKSRWRNRRTQNLSLLTSSSKTHLQMEQFLQSTCWTLAVDFRHLKEQNKEEEREKKKEESKNRPANLVGSWRWGETPLIKKDSLMEEKSAGTEKELCGIKGESSRRSVEGRTK